MSIGSISAELAEPAYFIQVRWNRTYRARSARSSRVLPDFGAALARLYQPL
jgi:hypothetical protein